MHLESDLLDLVSSNHIRELVLIEELIECLIREKVTCASTRVMREEGFLNHAVVLSIGLHFVVVRVCRIQGLIRRLQVFWFYAVFRPLEYKIGYKYDIKFLV